jgi:hypothetical protein
MTANRVGAKSCLMLFWFLALPGCSDTQEGQPGQVFDEPKRVGRTVDSLPAAGDDYFHDMDGGVALNQDEIKGRDTWIVWTGGNDRFWDKLSTLSVGNLDLLKTISSYGTLKFNRDNRWEYLGLVNEPCFDKASGPDPQRFGLWLDKRRSDCPADPFEDATRYPGIAIGARGKNMPVGSYYGYATGIVGLRLFPNPDFDEKAAKDWNPERYYTDPAYYNRKELVKPYRVGMSCAFCHVGPNPLNPPADPENPKWENLSSNVGAQYFWIDRIFTFDADSTSFVYQVFHTSRPGTLDTSLVSTDNINNPRTMNAVYGLGPRLELAKRWGKETLSGGSLDNRQFNDFVKDGPLTKFFEPPATVWSPRVLKDGSDSVGALGALNRVYLNIGLFSEEWLLHFNALIGGKSTSPIRIADARKNSIYWQATEQQTPDMALFFLKSTGAHKLADAPGGSKYLTSEQTKLTRGKEIFADRCARCHSSKIPTPAPGVDPGGCSGANYLACFRRYWSWTKTDEFKAKMRDIVLSENFLEGNFLSTELRIPVTLLQTNACSPLATNAIADNIWDNFSSQTYKQLPSVGTITVHHPITGEPRPYEMPAGGRGYTRPASLISLWSTAPFLLNNSLGKFESSPAVDARMRSFNDSIEKLLWPEKRDTDAEADRSKSSKLTDFSIDLSGTQKVPGVIDRTTTTSYLRVAAGYIPNELRWLLKLLGHVEPNVVGNDAGIKIGPIPAGTPVNLLANLNLRSDSTNPVVRLWNDIRVAYLLHKIIGDLKALPDNPTDSQSRAVFANLVDPLLELSTCPDFVVNRGHYFGTRFFTEPPDFSNDQLGKEPGLSDEDKMALIEFLKTF